MDSSDTTITKVVEVVDSPSLAKVVPLHYLVHSPTTSSSLMFKFYPVTSGWEGTNFTTHNTPNFYTPYFINNVETR